MKKYLLKKIRNTSLSSPSFLKKQIIERKCWNKYLQVYQSNQFCIKNEKNKQIKYNTADQVVDMQAVNFVLIKHNWTFFVLDHNR